ncbi:FtsW/RodA/SpoVE family cell cycle protein [Petrocella sp. FN5]|uniref:FtsW/RodA/SpoVE family cell cycle protein n=1 Tax=Petrocella sp. FN5 TaxID=3032002 RepID=UPI0023DA59CC|nr:FtsW/RodA/SpoVE family cell cycle protein [Petrocella sp. FN5]MDF1616320.1 FtsW/RodA/SpoVE family cell cycle protein [Petrocella sp. FN5]
MFKQYDFKRFDYVLVLLIALLGIIGIVAIGSATRVYSPDGTSEVVNKQMIGYILGFCMLLFFAFFDYHWLGKLAIPIYIFSILLLSLVLVAGASANNAVRWIDLGPFRLQPSEFAKIFLVLVLAKYFDKFESRINQWYIILGSILLTLVPTILIIRQPDLSTGLIMFLILAFIIYVSGISYLYVVGASAVLIPSALIGLWYIQQPDQTLLKGYQVNRIISLIRPDSVDPSLLMQTNNSIQAIGSGRIFGKGLYLGKVNQYDYLPEPQTDFIFSIIGEEFGFFGCTIVILLLFILILKCLWIAKDASDLFGKLIITGVVAIITYQSFINIGVTIGIVPNTGIPLPFISAGLSSLMANMIGMGIILNIGMQRKSTLNK